MVAAAIGVGAATGLAGAAVSSSASKSAADTQADAANRAADLQNQQWQQTQANLKPYMQLGSSSISPLLAAMGYNVTQNSDGTYSFNGTNPNNILQQQFTAPTEAQAQSTPGYQFTLNQGLKSVQNSAAARGLARPARRSRAPRRMPPGLPTRPITMCSTARFRHSTRITTQLRTMSIAFPAWSAAVRTRRQQMALSARRPPAISATR